MGGMLCALGLGVRHALRAFLLRLKIFEDLFTPEF